MLTITEQLNDFIEAKGNIKSRWLVTDKMLVQVSYGPRFLPLYKGLEQVNCLEISSVTVEPEFQHKGHFKLFLENAEELCRDFSIDALYVGNVINKFLCKFLERQRYRRHTLGGQISYFKAL